MSDSVRRLDAQGRLLIPAHLRDQLAIGADTPLKISTDGQTIRVSPSGIRCSLCGEGEGTIGISVGGPTERFICKRCAKNVYGIVRNERRKRNDRNQDR